MKVAHSLSTARAVVLALSVLCGCASTLPPAPPPPPPAVPATRFVAAPVFDDAEEDEWVGSYEGVADIYLAEEDSWQRGVAIQLFVQRDGQHLRILGQLALAASRHSFYVGDVEAGAEPIMTVRTQDVSILARRSLRPSTMEIMVGTDEITVQRNRAIASI